MPHLANTLTVDLDVESLRVQNKLALPFEIDTLSLEVVYSFYDGEPTNYNNPGCGASIEIESVVVEYAYGCIELYNPKLRLRNITASLHPKQSDILLPLLDTDAIETLIWESIEGAQSDNYMG